MDRQRQTVFVVSCACLQVLVYGMRTGAAASPDAIRHRAPVASPATPGRWTLCFIYMRLLTDSCVQVLVYGMRTVLSLLHPLTPFVTERLWQAMPHQGSALIAAPWPVSSAAVDSRAVQHFEVLTMSASALVAYLGGQDAD